MKTNPRANYRHSGRSGHADRPSYHRPRRSRMTASEKAEQRAKFDRENDAAQERLRQAMAKSFGWCEL
ncbi:MAG: hypothetical protein WBV94_24755 [Blastocatellia bacterium]